MIRQLKINHFKAFEDEAKLEMPNGENALIFGENGAGKSSLYQALKLIFHKQKIFDKKGISSIADPNERQREVDDLMTSYNHQKSRLTNFTIDINNTPYTAFSTAGYDVSMICQEDIQVEDVIDVVQLFNNAIVGIPDPAKFITERKESIEQNVNNFLKNYFCENNLSVELTYNKSKWILTITDNSRGNLTRNEELTHYFNEAKLHIIKLLLLFTAVLYNGAKERGDTRILVLDDVITSMDASNRTLFIEFLKKFFDEYQILLMTHSISFFNMAEYTFSIPYQQRDKWCRFQIVEHEGSSEVVNRDFEDTAKKISKAYHPGINENDMGVRIRKRFEFLVGEVSKLLCTGGLAESSKLFAAINTPKKLYYHFDGTKNNTVYDLVDELVAIIDAAPTTPLKSQLRPVIDKYESGNELQNLRNTLCELVIFQKVSMHPLSHASGAVPLSNTREVKRAITLLFMLEKLLDGLIGRDVYSI